MTGQYERRILSGLLDSYENSLLSEGKNQKNIRIKFAFTRKTIPEYFNESSLVYEEIHASMEELEQRGLIAIVWKGNHKGHIIEKVLLNEEHLQDVYDYLGRTSRVEMVRQTLELVKKLRQNGGIVTGIFADYLTERLKAGKPVREYIEIADPEGTGQLFQALAAIEQNQKSCYIREFSIRVFHNSKKLESMLGILGKIFRRFGPDYEDMDVYAILAEYRIFHTPDYVYLKGAGTVTFKKEKTAADGSEENYLDLSLLTQGIGISGDDLERVYITGAETTKRVITIENLTTFFRWSEENALIVYLGGYHNLSRRRLLKQICLALPGAEYLHFGDIDIGGFEIYRDLCEKTGIPFRTYRMGEEELEKYRESAQPLTENDKKRLERLLDPQRSRNHPWKDSRVPAVLLYMKENGIKLEQEAILQEEI